MHQRLAPRIDQYKADDHVGQYQRQVQPFGQARGERHHAENHDQDIARVGHPLHHLTEEEAQAATHQPPIPQGRAAHALPAVRNGGTHPTGMALI